MLEDAVVNDDLLFSRTYELFKRLTKVSYRWLLNHLVVMIQSQTPSPSWTSTCFAGISAVYRRESLHCNFPPVNNSPIFHPEPRFISSCKREVVRVTISPGFSRLKTDWRTVWKSTKKLFANVVSFHSVPLFEAVRTTPGRFFLSFSYPLPLFLSSSSRGGSVTNCSFKWCFVRLGPVRLIIYWTYIHTLGLRI